MAIALSIAYTATPLAAGTKLLVEATPQSSPGRTFFRRSEFKTVMVSAAAAVSPANVLASYNALFGALVSGKKIAFRLTPISAGGFRGEPQEYLVTVT
jgi:hypothetical protein